MTIQIMYSSLGGNTKRLAESLGFRINDSGKASATVASIDETVDPSADLYVLCSWIDKGRPDSKSLATAQAFDGKDVVLFATLGASPLSDHGKKCLANMKEAYKGAHVLGTALVQGSVSRDVISRFSDLPEGHVHFLTEEKKAYYKSIEDRPNKEDFDRAYEALMKAAEGKLS